MTPRWTAQGDGVWTAGGYRAETDTPFGGAWTLTGPGNLHHTGTAQECRQIAAQHAQEVMQ